MDNDNEAYILLLLSDSNLPTGSFVASAGLESYVTHGFLSSPPSSHLRDRLGATMDFVRDSLAAYARSALPFVSDAHQAMKTLCDTELHAFEEMLESTLVRIKNLDNLYEAMTLNQVSRRASRSQGVALLTLYSKGFARPPSLERHLDNSDLADDRQTRRESFAGRFMGRLKLEIRREDTQGHLPVCWGVLTSSLGLSLERSQFLHLFLHARSLLSASVRLNTVGPYAAQQLLLHGVRPLVETEAARCRNLRTGYESAASEKAAFDETGQGPAVTWPLGEILAARHDLQHSRIFNS
ncbi:uncharacterized protein LAESUDRAFT_743894 [Laetiporus sulphureus 93-53]|uniref:Urease accessory protein UreF n=1 Tax=Laetiporus sulphureus 93-53 TaxID=1314785 RepID=A0A165DUF6_9APHY|nr:uncharacterized protein LAESUDRAFT_743894 [Laetiporus sulphureus 93-53]KZT05650.1 hypothetical protein LAESUDRAFT_743894 [Laetiporus sulphureus 93-53]